MQIFGPKLQILFFFHLKKYRQFVRFSFSFVGHNIRLTFTKYDETKDVRRFTLFRDKTREMNIGKSKEKFDFWRERAMRCCKQKKNLCKQTSARKHLGGGGIESNAVGYFRCYSEWMRGPGTGATTGLLWNLRRHRGLEETIVMRVGCGVQRGDWVSTIGSWKASTQK